MSKKEGWAATFGQQEDYACNAACLRYFLWHYYGKNHTEQVLFRTVLREDKNGNSATEVAEAAEKLGFFVYARYLTGYRFRLGEMVQSAQVQAGDEEELED